MKRNASSELWTSCADSLHKRVELDGASYVSSPVSVCCKLQNVDGCSLATAIALSDDQRVTKQYLQETLERWTHVDDVFHKAFLRLVVLMTPTADDVHNIVADDAVEFLRSIGNKSIEVLKDRGSTIATGVYFAEGGRLYEAYRLYEDTHGAFMASTLRGKADEYLPLTTFKNAPSHDMIAVPSRVSSVSANAESLEGMRIAVKDNFHLKGVRTSLCNQAYLDTYPARNETAKCITKLVKLGGHVIGTTKLAAFAATEEPLECIDFQAPWNPRADGHQSPAGSSSGSGVAVAAYQWVDVAIGSDTSGSGRRPAHWNGVFAVRPTHGAIDVTGFTPSFQQFDTPSFLCRDIYLCKRFVAAWYGDQLKPARFKAHPWRLVVLTEYLALVSNPQQLDIIDRFLSDLEAVMDVKQTRISLEGEWNQEPPPEADHDSLADYMKTACRDSFFYDDYHSTDAFRRDYEKKFSKSAYVSPPLRSQWDLSSQITEAQRDHAVQRLSVFKVWFMKHIMAVDTARTVVVLPIENIAPRYRDEATTHFVPQGVPMLFLSPIIGGPECVIPAGHVTYDSRVSGNQELLPVGLSLLAQPDADLELLELAASCLEGSGRPTKVLPGGRMF